MRDSDHSIFVESGPKQQLLVAASTSLWIGFFQLSELMPQKADGIPSICRLIRTCSASQFSTLNLDFYECFDYIRFFSYLVPH